MAKKAKSKCYENYRNGGHKEINKHRKQERHEKRMARFAKRKEEGKSYKYSKAHSQAKIKAAETMNLEAMGNYDPIEEKFLSNVNSDKGRHTPFAKWKSVMHKLQNNLETIAIEEEKKARAKAKKGSGNNSKRED